MIGFAVWGLALLLVLSSARSRRRTHSEKLLAAGFACGLLAEVALVGAGVFALQRHEPAWMIGIPPVILSWLGGMSVILIVGGFLARMSPNADDGARYVRLTLPAHGLASAVLCAPLLLTSGRLALGMPRPAFAILASAIVLPALAYGAVVVLRRVEGETKWWLLGGMAFFFVWAAQPAITRLIGLGPPQGGLNGGFSSTARIAGTVLLGYLFVRMNASEIQADMHQLEEQVRQRTAHLEQALEKLEVANLKLTEQSTIDSLTGAYNRRYFDESLEREWARASREQLPLAVALVDLDHFKEINDRLGHAKGDECLLCVAAFLKGKLRRPADIAARYGGDEFAVILPNTGDRGAAEVMDSIRRGIEALSSRPCPNLSVSIGVASCTPSDGLTAAALLRRADENLYSAKQAGRNRVVSGQAAPAREAKAS